MSRLLPVLSLLLLVAFDAHAGDPSTECRRAIPRLLARCVGKTATAELSCHERTGTRCTEEGGRTTDALERLGRSIKSRCANADAVAAAGYAPFDPAGLADHLAAACAREVEVLRVRAWSGNGGDRRERRCRRAVGREGRRLLTKMLRQTGACTQKPCDLDAIEASHDDLADRATVRIARACDDLPAEVGIDAGALVAATRAQLASVAASPCDPLDEARCLFPFPSDHFTRPDPTAPSGRRLAASAVATPMSSSGTPVDPSRWNELDGSSTGPLGLVHLPSVDLAATGAAPIEDIARSLDPNAPIVLVDAETGERQQLWVERDQGPSKLDERALMIRVGRNLKNARRYLVALRGLRDGAGALLPASPAFSVYRDRIATDQLPLEARRPAMEDLFARLDAFGIPRAELQLAWDFTTQSTESVSRKLLHMRDDALDVVLGSEAPAFQVESVTEPVDAKTFRIVDGTFQSPLYLTNGGAPGALLRRDENGLPVNEGDFFPARFRCVVPYSATTDGGPPAVPGRGLLYGHGLLGNEHETSAGHVRDFSSEHDFIACGTRWTGFEEDDLPTVINLILNSSDFPRFIDRQHQGILNFMVLGLLLRHPDGLASHPAFQVGGQSVIDPSATFYDGNSQGGILGGVLAAFERDIERFVLGVPGINYSTLLSRSTDFVPFFALLQSAYPNGLDRALVLAVAQILWDQTDPNGHVGHVTSDPYPNTPAKKLLYQVAYGDHQVANVTVEVAARTNGAHIHQPALSPDKVVPDVQPYFGISPIPSYPFDGSAVVIWDSGNPAPPLANLPPPAIGPSDPEWADLGSCAQSHGSDPHECPRRQPSARLQKSEFLRIDGAVIDVCGGGACLAPAN